MFKQLRIRLTLINLLTLGLVIAVVLSGIYVGMQRNLSLQSERVMRFAAMPQGGDAQPKRPVPPEFQRHMAECFSAAFNSQQGHFVAASEYQPLKGDVLDRLAKLASKENGFRGYIAFEGQQYHYLKSERGPTTIVFMDKRFESELLGHLIGVYVVIGAAVALLLSACSLFLADRALVPIRTSWDKQKKFVADASHELRSPLAVIRSNLDVVMMNREESVESQMRWLKNIESESLRMTKMVQDLLLLARVDAHQEQMNWTLCNLDILVSQACEKMGPSAAEKGIQLTCKISEEREGMLVQGDEAHLQQLLMNLLDNSLKYTEEGGEIQLSVEGFSGHRHDKLAFSVSDTGCGIPELEQEKIFERFYRVDSSRSRSVNGTGLGLSIAKWIVDAHKGSMEVRSIVNEGTVFTVVLPVRQMDAKQ